MADKGPTLSAILERLFSDDSDQPSAILNILDSEERSGLEQKIGEIQSDDRRALDLDDVAIKIETISTLLVVLGSNQRLRNSITGAEEQGRVLLSRVYGLAYELNKTAFLRTPQDDQRSRMQYLLQMALNGLLADRHSEVSPFVNKYISEFSSPSRLDVATSEDVYYSLNYLLLLTVKVIRTSYDKEALLEVASIFEYNFNALQNSDLQILKDNPNVAYGIAALGNIAYVHASVLDYLFSGETRDKTSVYSLIESYSFNAISLLKTSGDIEYERFTYLLQYFFTQLCRNSVWNIADRSPAINDFFKKCISSTNNILYTLLPPQRDRILDILTVRKSVVINMPTSAGKSLLAELNILFTLHNSADADNPPTVCYVVPTNALINQVKMRLSRNFEGLPYRVDGVLPFFEVDPIEDELLTRTHIDVLVSTPEKLDALLRRSHASVNNLKLIVLDEAHNINDESRGSKIELLLSTIKTRKPEARFLLMSPFVDNAKEVARWLGDTEQDSLAVSYEWTPTKQYVGASQIKRSEKQLSVRYFPSARDHLVEEPFDVTVVNSDDKIQLLSASNNATDASIIELIDRYVSIGNILVVCRGTGTAEKVAKKILVASKERGWTKIDSQRLDDVVSLVKLELGEESILAECLMYGIAYHHSQLPSTVKEELEDLIREGLVKVVTSTTTLAQGMNFPITTVLFSDLQFGGGSNMRDLDNQLFWNIAGRAGRAYMDTEGHIILLQKASSTQESIREKTKSYIKKDLQSISSTLTKFFQTLDATTTIDSNLISNNLAISNFLQYLNHIIRVSHDYNFNNLDLVKIRAMLSNSLAFQEIEFESGFIEAQQQALGFTRQYIERLKTKQTSQLTLADMFGISDISLGRVHALISSLKDEVAAEYGANETEKHIQASSLILNSKSDKDLSKVVEILSKIPELQVYIDGRGTLNSEHIARVIIGWVNGEDVRSIASSIKYPDQKLDDVVGLCHKYINGRLKTFIPWGMSIYQKLTGDDASDEAKSLPSYIYFGVNDRDSVVLSAAGVPRYALEAVKAAYASQFGSGHHDVKKMDEIKSNLRNLDFSNVHVKDIDSSTIQRLVGKYI